jgi:glycerol-1-phosphate dehydrogenase [NAD(P)+]
LSFRDLNKTRLTGVKAFEMDKAKIKSAIKLAMDTEDCLIGIGCISQIPEILKKYFPDDRVVVVADDNTFKEAGRLVDDKLKSTGFDVITPFVFPGKPILHADYRHVEQLKKFLINHHAIAIAVGSGTINDIAKLASYQSNRKYMVAPTAASVDGYSAYGASISVNGFKQTIECAAPLVIVADIQVLQNAPAEMTAAGYADLLGKITAGADWIIADSVNIETIGSTSWNMVQSDLRRWTSQPKKLSKGNANEFQHLMEGLIMSGLAMQIQKSSRPASGTEHLFSHTWEMQNLEKDGIPISHGYKVGIGTLAACAMMETVFAKNINRQGIAAAYEKYPSLEEREKQVRNAFCTTPAGIRLNGRQGIGRGIVEQAGEGIVDHIVMASHSKQLTRVGLRERLGIIESRWSDMRSKVKNQLLPYCELKKMLADAKCPISPDQINISREEVKETFFLAQMIRERYTVLDLAFEMGWLGDCVEEIFKSGAYF